MDYFSQKMDAENFAENKLFARARRLMRKPRFIQRVENFANSEYRANYLEQRVIGGLARIEESARNENSRAAKWGLDKWALGGYLGGRVYGAYFVWMFHLDGLHEIGKDKGHPFNSHWRHHRDAQKYGFYDPYHVMPADEKKSQQRGENKLMTVIAAAHAPAAGINPGFVGGVMQELWSFLYMHPRLHTDFLYALTNSEVHMDHHLPKHLKMEHNGGQVRAQDLNLGVWRPNIDNAMGTRWFYWRGLDTAERENTMVKFAQGMNDSTLNEYGPDMLEHSMLRWLEPTRQDRMFALAEEKGDSILERGLVNKPHILRMKDKFDAHDDPIREDLIDDCIKYIDIVEDIKHKQYPEVRDRMYEYVAERQKVQRKRLEARLERAA